MNEVTPYREALENFRKEYFKKLLEHTDGNRSAAARLAGIDRANFRKLLKRIGFQPLER